MQKNCQKCQTSFVIEPDDFSFYEKIKVPAPTFCPTCRIQRRFMFRNERTLYKSTCALCKESMISIFNPENPYTVFCSKCWWGDGWESGEYYLDYDPNKNFFEQMKELQLKTPFIDKIVGYSSLVNSDYVNHASSCKNCYLIYNAAKCENVYYTSDIVNLKDSSDCLMVGKAAFLYESIGGNKSSNVYFSTNCRESVNVWYSKDCVGCTDCFGCVNLRKKSYYIYNEPYSKEEYFKKLQEFELDKYSSHVEIQKYIYNFWNKFPYRYVHGRMNSNVTGDYVISSKNAKECYRSYGIEDSAYCQLITMSPFSNNYDITEWGNGVELSVEGITIGDGVSGAKYCSGVFTQCSNVEYGIYNVNCNNTFGCINLRKKEYCILNKQYTKEEYFALREKIIADLEKNPYIDVKGRIFKYGEFLPYDISPFSYNESFAMQYFPLSQKEIEENGFVYIESKKPDYKETIELENIPDSIHDISDEFIKEILKCNCGKFYRIVPGELQLLKRFSIPAPRKCPDCRHMFRMSLLNKPFLHDRNCDKCGMSIRTSFAPERPEIIYCEKCYQQEVV